MKVKDQLASSLNISNARPNQELAAGIAANDDTEAISELVTLLSGKSSAIKSDAIKTLYEIGYLKPSLIAGYAKEFILLLDDKNNRLVWGAMTALSTIAKENHALLAEQLAKIVDIADKGTVITRDHAVSILVQLGSFAQYSENVIPLLLEQLLGSPENQFPTYAEKIAAVLTEEYKAVFLKILNERVGRIETETKKKRVEKLIKKVTNK